MRLIAALVLAVATLGQQVDRAATRAGFSGEIAVARHGRIVFARGYGLANRDRGTKVTLDTAFDLASVGKTFTGVAAAQLVQAGKLRFADRVGTYLPQLPARLRRITVAQLLDHTSGLGDFFSDPGYDPTRLTTLESYLPLIERERLLFAPGTRWSYSNSGFLLAGLVVEKASGQRYGDYLRAHIWAPAGMSHTGCFAPTRLPRFAAVGYLAGGGTNTSGLGTGTPAGGCYSSARDLIRFADALESGKLLSPALVRTITATKVAAPGGGYGYGFGIRGTTVWHNGGAPGAAAELDVNPRLGIVVVTLGNVSPPQVFPVVHAALHALNVP